MSERKPAPPTPPDARDDEWERCHLYALTAEIGWCGCGWPGAAYDLVRDLLAHFHDRDGRDVVQMVGSEAAAQIVLYRLQQAHLIDHGTSVTSSWMTDKGRYALYLMRRHPHAELEQGAGFPACFDWREGTGCPDECWVPGPDVPPEPPRRTLDELMAEAKRESDEVRSRMSPAERAMCDQVDAQMTSMMLWGAPVPPPDAGPSKFTGFAGLLDDMAALTPLVKPQRDRPAESTGGQLDADAIDRAMRDMWNSPLFGPPPDPRPATGSTATGLFDALGGVTPASKAWPAGPDASARVVEWVLRTDEAANGPLGRAKWAPVDCICPWPWPTADGHVRLDCPRYEAPPKPVVGRNPYTECRRVDNTWIHASVHTCPLHARGQRR